MIVDDSLIAREGLRHLLESEEHQVVGVAGQADEAVRTVAATCPDAVILDVRMPPTHTDEGITLAISLRRQHPRLAVLVLSQYASPEFVTRLLEGGAARTGYLLKDRISEPDEVRNTLERLLDGGTVVDTTLVDELLAARRDPGGLARLTTREAQVLRLMAEGRSDRGIAAELFVSLNTVSTHAQRIFHKLDLPGAAHDNRRVLAVLTLLQRR
ncbi:response regulator [Actinoplanes sp. NPDC049265]|uniref:response regulator transcription factor n=1 Tax=Actinoplanes sp. NPDC049265 TaxID=3363902 RepID=UPI00371920D6